MWRKVLLCAVLIGHKGSMQRPNTYIGSPVHRVEDERFLRGAGCFTDDLKLPHLWHAAVLRSPVAHGRIVSIDASGALDMPGVRALITAGDVGGIIPVIPFRRPTPEIMPFGQPVIASDKVRYAGEPMGLVLADSAERAQDALAAVA